VTSAAPLAIVDAQLPGGGRGGVRCAGGLITAVGPEAVPQDGDEIVQAAGALLAPALIDFGVFAIDRPAFHFGGIARAALMPDQNPALDHPASVRFAAQSGKPGLWVHPLAAATQGLAGTQLAELALMRDAGAKAVATGRCWIADTGVMHRLLAYAAMVELVVVTHAEDSGLAGSAVATAGEMATRLGLPSAPAEAEVLAAARDIALAEMTGARLHNRQVTTAAALNLVRAAKARGVSVTAGVTPAHFALSETALGDFRTFARLSPPLRSEADRHAVRAALADGTIDVIASGHDPRGPEDKRLPFADAAPGMAGAETLLPLTLQLVRDEVIGVERALDLLCGAPARLLGVDAGTLMPGYQADMVLIDTDRPWIVDSDQMAAAAGNTPFDKLPVQGRATALWKGGVKIA
jgi:dihydroorotase